ncbi:hypothetical protein ElyMa_002243300, partial [Elysia marginata]
IRSLIKRKWHQYRLMTSSTARKNTGFTSSTYVDGYSVVDTTRDTTKITRDDAVMTAAGSGGSAHANNTNNSCKNIASKTVIHCNNWCFVNLVLRATR